MGLGLLASRALSFKSPNPRYAIVRTIVSTAKLQKPEAAAQAQPPVDDLQNRTPVGGATVHFSNPGRRDRGRCIYTFISCPVVWSINIRTLSWWKALVVELVPIVPGPLAMEYSLHLYIVVVFGKS
ncbi:hypothetical protein HYC85_001596 [Camellia sinensis]|uniref:Uncharacterized protein n=1 Tax=Camellia sinensis TaxID=4442 RepID=A0A7J7I749_CAMSI|nr:hypothetical protein HYC85_001596 [Camellia sinensis]